MAQDSTFTLKLFLGGLCLFHREPAEGAKYMHVLMPKTAAGEEGGESPSGAEAGRHAGHGVRAGNASGASAHAAGHGAGVDDHIALLIFDPAYGKPDGVPDPSARPVLVKLDGCAVGIKNGGGGGFSAELNPDKIVNLADVTGVQVKAGLTSGTLADVLGARLTLGAGGVADQEGDYAQGATWELKGERELSNGLIWTIEGLEGDRLNWTCSGAKKSLPPLYPNPDDRTIVAAIMHLAMDELPPDPAEKNPPDDGYAHHFAALYDLFDNPRDTPLPKYVSGPPSKSPKAGPKAAALAPQLALFRKLMSVSVYTCMSGGGGP